MILKYSVILTIPFSERKVAASSDNVDVLGPKINFFKFRDKIIVDWVKIKLNFVPL
jgi:hypothetical protein